MTLVCVFLAAAAAQAGITTSQVNVLVSGDCKDLNDVSLVINGDDLRGRWITLTPAKEKCHWTVNLLDGTISTSIARFSLRAGPKRSGCQKAVPDKSELSANITFSCCVEDPSPNVKLFRNVRLKIEPPMPASYFRYMGPFPEDVPGIQCREGATFAEGEGTIRNAFFKREHVYLYLGPFDRKRQAPGQLHLNEIVFEDGVRVLTFDGVVYRLMVKRAKGKLQSAPTTSPNAISLDIKKLVDLKFERAEFEVIK